MIKWFDSKLMGGLPELTNTQGDLVKMLTGLLVNGVNIKPVSLISYSNGICTLDVGLNHGFVRHSVVDIQGSNQTPLKNNEFKVSSVSSTTISFVISSTVTNEVGLTVRYSPLGFEQYFASEGKCCYKSKDPKYTDYLRVDDTKFSGVGAGDAKFASVEICSGMTDFDTAVSQQPYLVDKPLQNRQSTASGNGWFKWYYASAHTNLPDSTNSPIGRREYKLVGDGTYFWLILHPYVGVGISRYCAVYGFAKLSYGNAEKQSLIATNGIPVSNDAAKYPHASFINAGSEVSVAVLGKPLGFAIPTVLSVATNTNGITSFSGKTETPNESDVLVKNPIYMFYSGIKAEFKGVSTSNIITDTVFFAGVSSFLSISTNQNYNLCFDLGG